VSYVLTDPSYKWGTGVYGTPSGTITFGFDSSFYSDLRIGSGSFGDFEVAAEFALETWATVAAVDFAPAPAGTTPDILIAMRSLPGAQIGEALTTFILAGTVFQAISSVITLDADEIWSPFGEVGLNFYNVVLHEAGHSLGLDHPDDPTQVMYAFYNSDDTLSLGSGDIAGMQFLYGPAKAEFVGTFLDDTIDRSARTLGESIFGLAGDDLIFGTRGDDLISGGAGTDRIFGGLGNDRIANLTGDGELFGGDGRDTIFGGIGNNLIDGGPGDDVLVGGTGSDDLRGGGGRDLILGDPPGARFFGNDRIDGGPGDDFLTGGGGADVFVFRATGGNDTIARFDIDWLDPMSSTAAGRDFVPGVDRIAFETGTFESAAEVFAATETEGGSAVIRFGTTASLTLFGVTEAELSADSFIFGEAIA
jgi:hypothetical protein